MNRLGFWLFPLGFLLTLATYQGFASASVAQTLANLSRPLFSFFSVPDGVVAEEIPFFLIERNATFLAVFVASVCCLGCVYSELRFLEVNGKSWVSAGFIAISLVLLFFNARLLAWNV